MKMKKLVAIGAAAAMSMAMCVNAFAAITVSSEDSKFGSYADGVAKLADDSAIDATHQWTVVIIDAEKENSNLQASDLYYINQGTSAEGFWVTNGMGTKVDLTTLVNETTTEKNFIIRIGGETITEAQGIIQVPFSIKYTTAGREIQLGECDGITSAIDSGDAMAILNHFVSRSLLTGDALIAAECDGITSAIDAGDAMAVLEHFTGKKILGKVTVK